MADVESLPLELDDIPLFKAFNFLGSKRVGAVLGLSVEDLREEVVLLELLLGDEVIVFNEDDGDKGLASVGAASQVTFLVVFLKSPAR